MTLISTMTSPTHRVVVVAPSGALSVADVPALRAALRSTSGQPLLLVVDLLEVPTLDEAIVEVLVGASVRCRVHGVRFVVANANDQPWTALTRARIAGVLRLHRRAEPLVDILDLLEA